MAGSSSVRGDETIYHTDNICFDGTDRGSPMALDGQLWIGATASNRADNGGHVRLGSISSGTGIIVTNGPGTITISTSGASVANTLTGDSGGALSPTAGNWNLLGSGSITTTGSGSTLTTQLTGLTNHAVLVGAGTSTITKIAATANTGAVLQNNSGADPSYSTATYPSSSGGSGKILYDNGTNFIESVPTFPASASASTGKIVISDGTNWIASTPTYPNTSGSAGKVVISDGTNNVYSTPTFPNASATSGKVIISDGTNWIASTPTFPAAAGTSGNVLTSDGTNWTSAAAGVGGSFVFLAKATANNSASLDFTSSINSTYPNYMFIIENIRLASTTTFIMALSTNSLSTLVTTDRTMVSTDTTAATFLPVTNLGVTTGIRLNNVNIPTTTLSAVRGVVYLYDPSSSGTNTAISCQICHGSGTNPMVVSGSAYDTTAQTVNSVRFSAFTGNLTSGNIYMYGIKGS